MLIAILVISLLILIETSILLVQKIKPIRSSKRKIYLDSSALIDGRILEVARSGFIDGDLIILKSVLLEMQLIADSKEYIKRTRARAGLETAAELERVPEVNVEIMNDADTLSNLKKVDDKLLKIARDTKGAIMTTDYNLNKVATASKIKVLNVNDLAIAIRDEYELNKIFKIKITDKGSSPNQGVGHLPSGIMVVVEGAASKVGKELKVKTSNFIETPAGRMIFARIVK